MLEVVIINWKRPENVTRIANAFRRQSVNCYLKLCDVSSNEFSLPAPTLDLFDEVFRWQKNYGCYNRAVIGLSVRSPRVWFHDDDMEPGVDFVKSIERLPMIGGVVGQKGNLFDGDYYSNVEPGHTIRVVDFVSRGYLVKTEDIAHTHRFLNEFSLWDYTIHDDILMSKAIQFYTGRESLLMPELVINEKMNAENLPEPHCCWRKPTHRPKRMELIGKLEHIFQEYGKRFRNTGRDFIFNELI